MLTTDLRALFRLLSLSRALSLRNLVSGYEGGKALPGSVASGSPSGDAAEGWLLAEDDGVRQVHASSELQSSALREVAARERQAALSRRAW